jgi:hypothetical protein
MLGASAALSSQSPPQAADATKVGDIEVPTLGPAQDPLGIKTSATEFPCGGLRPAAHTATTEGAPHAYPRGLNRLWLLKNELSTWALCKLVEQFGRKKQAIFL